MGVSNIGILNPLPSPSYAEPPMRSGCICTILVPKTNNPFEDMGFAAKAATVLTRYLQYRLRT